MNHSDNLSYVLGPSTSDMYDSHFSITTSPLTLSTPFGGFRGV